MDEAIQPSIVEPASLLIRGVDAETSAKLAGYNWTTRYELSFVEPGTNEQKQYYVISQMHTPQPGTLRLELERDGIWDVPRP